MVLIGFTGVHDWHGAVRPIPIGHTPEFRDTSCDFGGLPLIMADIEELGRVQLDVSTLRLSTSNSARQAKYQTLKKTRSTMPKQPSAQETPNPAGPSTLKPQTPNEALFP